MIHILANSNDTAIVITVLVVLLGLALIVSIATILFTGAAKLFVFACEQGFIGLAAYFACWVFLLPAMLIGSFVVGVVTLWAEKFRN